MDKTIVSPGAIRVVGWSLDPQRTSASNMVAVTVDGHSVARVKANGVRGDVNRRLHVVGRHGFVTTVKARPGRHTVCVIGQRYGADSTKNGDLVDVAGGIHVTGWAFDPQHREATRTVRILLDGRPVANVSTSKLRSDVNRNVHLTGTHGFDTLVKATPGRHTVQVVAIPTGAMTSRAKVLRTATVTVPDV